MCMPGYVGSDVRRELPMKMVRYQCIPWPDDRLKHTAIHEPLDSNSRLVSRTEIGEAKPAWGGRWPHLFGTVMIA